MSEMVGGKPKFKELGARGVTGVKIPGRRHPLLATSPRYNFDGSPVNTSVVSGLSTPIGIAVSGSDLFIDNNAYGTMGEYTTSGARVNASLVTNMDNPN